MDGEDDRAGGGGEGRMAGGGEGWRVAKDERTLVL